MTETDIATKLNNELYERIREERGIDAAKLFESDRHEDYETRDFFYCEECRASFMLSEVAMFIAEKVVHHGHVHAMCPECGAELCACEAIEVYVAETVKTFCDRYAWE